MRVLTGIALVLLMACHAKAEEGGTGTITTNAPADIENRMEVLRDPFWPVGYIPAPPEPEVTDDKRVEIAQDATTKSKIRWPTLHLKGITGAGKNRYMAIIDGIGLVEVNETINMRRGDMLYSWNIDEISAKGVTFTRLEARPYQPPSIGGRTQ